MWHYEFKNDQKHLIIERGFFLFHLSLDVFSFCSVKTDVWCPDHGNKDEQIVCVFIFYFFIYS